MTDRRDYGTGSVYFRERDQRWVATVEAGWTATGARRRIVRTSRDEKTARALLRDLLREGRQKRTAAGTGRPTVKTWADTWLQNRVTTLRPTSWQTDRSQVANWIVPTIGHRRLDQLTPGDRRAVARAMEVAGASIATITRADAVLGKMLRDAIIEGHAVPQAILLVRNGGEAESDRDAIPLPDALAILEEASLWPDASRWVAALLQGMRPAECLGLTWDRVDLDDYTFDVSWQLKRLPYVVARDRSSGFRVPRGYIARQVHDSLHLVRPKTAKGRRIIPLVPWMVDSLTAWRDVAPTSNVGLVWPRPDGTPRRDDDDRQAWRDLCDTAQVAHIDGTTGRRYTLYEARHTTATLLREAGVDEETIKAIMGHASILSTKAYLHTDSRRTRAALEAVAGRLQLGANVRAEVLSDPAATVP